MFSSMRALLLIALIGITSVLAAPTLSAREEAIHEPPRDTSGKPLVQSPNLLTGAWFGTPHPNNLPGLPPNAKSAVPDDWVMFGHREGQFVWHHGHSRGPYRTEPNLQHPEVLKAYPSSAESWQNWRVDLLVPRYASRLVGYWCNDKTPGPNSKFIGIILVAGKFLVRELGKQEKEWVLGKLSGASS
ncbi:hypothetical protein F5887DRAFT_970062 [Amanita rubescens]|nr:hypothetical protein F5887DRAFT_970062 [Amanita rubescens]